ncbi:DUF4181 domain-containing protein [Halalkalibacillus halophilus]|uniref:DUF4181 domain-containing protein n=1 Tax=Halalkalibacillus halophilus TaxID=392827 RepID=UPI00040BD744|nr:DUF4181 domain-containing protein [Halalkalibacillus halophilus]
MDWILPLILILLNYGAFIYILEKFLRKQLDIKKPEKKWGRDYVNDLHKKLTRSIVIPLTILAPMIISYNIHRMQLSFLVLVFLIPLLETLLNTIMEYLYRRERKQYIIFGMHTIVTLVFFTFLASNNFFDLIPEPEPHPSPEDFEAGSVK